MLPFKGSSFARALTDLHGLCFKEPWSFHNFETILNLPTTFGFGDEKGFILCSDLGDDLEILTLAIHPDYRRKGYASCLLQELQKYAQLHHKKKIFLEVKITNTPAVNLYFKHNFVQTGIRKNYYHEDDKTVDALCLTWQQKTSD